jgi:hypothetical protein
MKQPPLPKGQVTPAVRIAQQIAAATRKAELRKQQDRETVRSLLQR